MTDSSHYFGILSNDDLVNQDSTNDIKCAECIDNQNCTFFTLNDILVNGLIPHSDNESIKPSNPLDLKIDEMNKCFNSSNFEDIRKRYYEFYGYNKTAFTKDIMEDMWASFLLKINTKHICEDVSGFDPQKLNTLKLFALSPESRIISIFKCHSKGRYEYHKLCSLIGFHHVSVNHDNITGNKLNNVAKQPKITKSFKTDNYSKMHNEITTVNVPKLKTLFIIKPEIWNWEFTQTENINISDIVDLSALKRFTKSKTVRNSPLCHSGYCARCGVSRAVYDMFVSNDLTGYYCEKCSVNSEMTKHKFRKCSFNM